MYSALDLVYIFCSGGGGEGCEDCEGLVVWPDCWLQCRARTGPVSNYDDTATLWALRKWTRFIFRSVMEIAASHHTDPDNDPARYRYKEIPGILLAFYNSFELHQQALLNCSNFQPSEISIQWGGRKVRGRRGEVLTRSGRKEEALLVSLLCRTMQGNTISAWSNINRFGPRGEDNAGKSSHWE